MALTRQGITTRDELAVPVPAEELTIMGRWMRDFVGHLQQSFRIHQHLFPAAISGELKVNRYTNATKPAAATAGAGAIIFVSDGGAGAVFQGSTGAAWVNLG